MSHYETQFPHNRVSADWCKQAARNNLKAAILLLEDFRLIGFWEGRSAIELDATREAMEKMKRAMERLDEP